LHEGGTVIVAKVTSKGQVTIPKEVREKLGVHTGEELGFEERDGLMVISKVLSKSPFDKWMGSLHHLKGRRSDDVVKEARGDDQRG
jgi:antitoxin PrlF